MLDDIKKQIGNLEVKLNGLHGLLDLEKKQGEIVSIEEQMNAPDFWNDTEKSNKLMKEMKYLKGCVEPFLEGVKKVEELKELAEISEDDEELLTQIQKELTMLVQEIDKTEFQIMLSGPFDKNNVILSINAGAGGTESCDWSGMLLRMYTRWAESQGHKVKLLDELIGEEAGIKNVTLSIEGEMAYGNLKGEKGVHRLVRISPFDSNKRRHTSFASVDVIPEVEDDIEIEINDEDLRIDIFRSSGPGGQSVNTTDSAVRMTHLPTGTVVQCQNERSQLSNKQTAMKILKARLYEKRRQEQEAEMSKEYGQKQKIEWGSQIRSYVMHPYSMVKDHRTSVETGNVAKVMDGGLEGFIEGYLRWRPKGRE
ncbi:Peptide chain release factor 2 @ programmed frameshift-containing [hydrothermal vent metagenome]|uniref:Peptide chain release factor 2 @ programmed frameshift-containing n=1 Tax=hydrothermal vent metagenome TaxID=652676 RepID=A0A3B0VQT6_9ZZZZ